jgi:predicted enzyme related to lactoylglutathione lyase
MKTILALLLFLGSVQAVADAELRPQYVGAVGINPSHDPKVLADWYSKLGLETQQMSDGGYYCTFATASGQFFFGIHPKAKHAPRKSSGSISLVFQVEDFDAYVSQVSERGLKPEKVEQDAEGHYALFRDPDGNQITLWGK